MKLVRFGSPKLAIDLTVMLAAAAGVCAQSLPDPAEDVKILHGIREAALAYDEKLPNFFCTQLTTRERRKARLDPGVFRGVARPDSDAEFRRVDSVEQQLSYFEHKESYKLVKVNGKPPGRKQKAPSGATSTGEFGTMLRNIFDPESHARFQWKRWDTLRGRRVAVFAFTVDRSYSRYELITPAARVVVDYRGMVFADGETNTVLRVTTEADSPPNFPFQGTRHTLDYGYFSIAGEQFVLPLRDELQFQAPEDFVLYGSLGGNSPQIVMRNVTEFRDYRRYTAESELKFEPETK